MELIKPFKTLNKNDAAIAGGKGASLGEMTQAGIPVPPGFVVLAGTFERFIEETDINLEIDTILRTVDPQAIHTVDAASEKIQALIKSAQLPQDIADEILKQFDLLGADYVAVRSSATAEDSASAAWAGQLDSYLNTTREVLLKRVQHCWASLFTPRAIFYRFEKDLDQTKISVAVVVQKMVNSEKSGIAFSVHPVTEDRNHLIIEAGFGLGEAIVSGQITPDSYVVEKEPRRIIDTNVSEQSRGLFRIEGGGNEWRELGDAGSKQVLTEAEILELAEIILQIENHYGFPCDIEWAYENGKFYIVQSRPITTLSNNVKTVAVYHKIMARTMVLLDCEIWDTGERLKLPKVLAGVYAFDPLFSHTENKGIEVYYNFTDPAQAPKHLIDYLTQNPAWFSEAKNKFDAQCEEIRDLIKQAGPEDFKKLYNLLIEVWPIIAISTVLANEEYYPVSKELVAAAIAVRNESDGVLHWGTEKVLELAERLVPAAYKAWAEYLSSSEIISNELPTTEELVNRKSTYVFHQGKLYSGQTLAEYAAQHKLEIKGYVGEDDDSQKSLKGTTAFPGKVRGKVALIFQRSDIDKVKAGDILVTAMTTPNLISAMKKAAAFVTDEGGITCHAAIVARELKKPCIIGIKIATKVLQDGDLVEVDATTGVVTIISKTNPSIEASNYPAITEKMVFRGKRRVTPHSARLKAQSWSTAWQEELGIGYRIAIINSAGENWMDEQSAIELRDFFHQKDFNFAKAYMTKFDQLRSQLLDQVQKDVHGDYDEQFIRLLAYCFIARNVFEPLFESLDAADQKLIEAWRNNGQLFLPMDIWYEANDQEFVDDEWSVVVRDGQVKMYPEKLSFFENEPTESNILNGDTAYAGKVTGTVRVILSPLEFDQMQPGEILVASMTTPDYTPVLKKAAAIVTDEGGVTSHAAIYARELQVPCVIGTRRATKALKTGDLVEIDATAGIVRIIK